MSTTLVTLTRTLAQKLDMGDGGELVDTLKAKPLRVFYVLPATGSGTRTMYFSPFPSPPK